MFFRLFLNLQWSSCLNFLSAKIDVPSVLALSSRYLYKWSIWFYFYSITHLVLQSYIMLSLRFPGFLLFFFFPLSILFSLFFTWDNFSIQDHRLYSWLFPFYPNEYKFIPPITFLKCSFYFFFGTPSIFIHNEAIFYLYDFRTLQQVRITLTAF